MNIFKVVYYGLSGVNDHVYVQARTEGEALEKFDKTSIGKANGFKTSRGVIEVDKIFDKNKKII